MALPRGMKIVFGGFLNAGAEVWSTSLSVVQGSTVTSAQCQAEVNAAAVAFADNFLSSTVQGYFAAYTNYRSCRGYQYDAGGNLIGIYDGAGTSWHKDGTDTYSLPTECSVVVSLRTGDVSRSGRGRMYLPPLGAAVLTAPGRLSVAVRENLALAAKGLVEDINAVDSVSTVAVLSATKGTAAVVTSVRVGDVIDSQRRRRDALDETYTSETISL